MLSYSLLIGYATHNMVLLALCAAQQCTTVKYYRLSSHGVVPSQQGRRALEQLQTSLQPIYCNIEAIHWIMDIEDDEKRL